MQTPTPALCGMEETVPVKCVGGVKPHKNQDPPPLFLALFFTYITGLTDKRPRRQTQPVSREAANIKAVF